MSQKVIKTGNSIAVTIPARFAKDLGIRVGDSVRVRLDPSNGRIIYNFQGSQQLPLLESMPPRRKRK